jgi:hypothetical protein
MYFLPLVVAVTCFTLHFVLPTASSQPAVGAVNSTLKNVSGKLTSLSHKVDAIENQTNPNHQQR